MKSLLLLLIVSLYGCGTGDRHFAAVAGSDTETAFYAEQAVDIWNAGTDKVGLVYVSDPALADVVIQSAHLIGECGRTNWAQWPTDYGTNWQATIKLDVHTDPRCAISPGPIVAAHELGHYMSGRRHSPDPQALMAPQGGGLAHLDNPITATDVAFVFGYGPEVK